MKARGRNDFFLWLKLTQRLLFTDKVLVLRNNPSLWYMNAGRDGIIARIIVNCGPSKCDQEKVLQLPYATGEGDPCSSS